MLGHWNECMVMVVVEEGAGEKVAQMIGTMEELWKMLEWHERTDFDADQWS